MGLIRKYFTAGTMLIVAGIHYARVESQHLTPWKGGGFGMFSCVDAGGSRILECRGRVDGSWYPLLPPAEAAEYMKRATNLPSNESLNRLLSLLRKNVWTLDVPSTPLGILPQDGAFSSLPDFGLRRSDLDGSLRGPFLRTWNGSPTSSKTACTIDAWSIDVLKIVYQVDASKVSVIPLISFLEPSPTAP